MEMGLTIDELSNFYRGNEVFKLLTALFDGEMDLNEWYIYPSEEAAIKPGITVAYLVGLRRYIPVVLWGKETTNLVLFRAPFIVIGGLTCVILYLVGKELFDTKIALISSLLLALEPFHASLSRIVGADQLTTFFTLVLILAFVRWLKTRRRIWWVVSAIAMGIGSLTKITTVIMVPILFTWMIFYTENESQDRKLKNALRLIIPYCFIALITLYALWPWFWSNPISRTLEWITTSFADTGSGHTTFYLGKVTEAPGWTFYPVALIFRLTAIEFLGVVFFIIFLLRDRPSGPLWNKKKEIFMLFSWIILFILFMTLIPKKLGARYILQVFPAVLIIATLGWFSLFDRLVSIILRLSKNIPKKFQAKHVQIVFGIALLSVQAYPLFIESPDYYYDYFNPLLGGSENAAKVVAIGWGEGLNVIADYFEDLDDDDDKPNIVIFGYEGVFNRHYNGPNSPAVPSQHESDDFTLSYVLENFDYIVFQLNKVQRRFQEEIWIYFSTFTPEFTLEAYGVTLFWVYSIPPR